MKLAMPVEKSGQTEFDFQYGDEFGDHIERFDPDFVKVLVRYNPDGDPDLNRRQAERCGGSRTGSPSTAELSVRAPGSGRGEQLASVDGDTERYDAELRPALMVRRDRRASGRRGRARRLEDRGSGPARGLRAGRRPVPSRRTRPRGLRRPRARRRARQGGALAHQRRRRRWLHRIRDRPLDLGRPAVRVPRRRL